MKDSISNLTVEDFEKWGNSRLKLLKNELADLIKENNIIVDKLKRDQDQPKEQKKIIIKKKKSLKNF